MQTVTTVADASLITFPKVQDKRGNLTFIEAQRHVPFEIERVYWIYDVPGGEQRGGHAFREQQEVIIALSGSFDVVLDDGLASRVVCLNRAYFGLYVPSLIWRKMQNFSTNSVAYVLANQQYDECDYMREYREYIGERCKMMR
jgi:dTDP-4-dehydrorhamnose 3,5-epimerase-like enzyme